MGTFSIVSFVETMYLFDLFIFFLVGMRKEWILSEEEYVQF